MLWPVHPPHAAFRTFSTTKKSVRSDAHYVGRTGLRLGRAVFSWPESKGQRSRAVLWPVSPRLAPGASRARRALPPRSAPRSEHAARWECSVSETPRAAADRDAATPRKLPIPQRRTEKETGSFDSNASPSPAPPGVKAQPKQKTSPGQGGAHPEMFHVEHFAGPQFCKNNVPRGTF